MTQQQEKELIEQGWSPVVSGRHGLYTLTETPNKGSLQASVRLVTIRELIQKFAPTDELRIELLEANPSK